MTHRGADAPIRSKRFFAVCLTLLLGSTAWLSPSWFVAIKPKLIAFLLAFGLLHGVFDWWIASRVHTASSARFFVSYLACTALVCVGWWQLPALSLAGFLALSVYHFGEGDLFANGYLPSTLGSLSRGSVLLALPLLWHFDSVQPVLHVLLHDEHFGQHFASSPMRPMLMLLLIGQHLVWLCMGALRNQTQGELLRLGLLCAFFAASDILLGFAVYFAVWHSEDHWRNIRTRLKPQRDLRQFIYKTTPIALVSILGAAAFSLFALRFYASPPWALVFVGLSAVTLPHALLVRQMLHRPGQPLGTLLA